MFTVQVLGNLTRDPEMRFFENSDSSVCNFGVAVNDRYTNRDGDVVERPCFIDCEAWGRQGEVIAEYFVKGQQIYIIGEMKQDQWETDDGEKRSKHKVRVTRFSFTGTKAENEKLREDRDNEDDDSEFGENGDEDIPF